MADSIINLTVVQSLHTPPRLQIPPLEEQQGGWIKIIGISMTEISIKWQEKHDWLVPNSLQHYPKYHQLLASTIDKEINKALLMTWSSGGQ